MKFRQYLEAVISGDENPQSYSDLDNFNDLKKDKFKGAKVLADNIGPDKLKLIVYNKNVFYLATPKNIYQGFLEVRIEDKVRIVYSHSAMKGGFYSTIFENVLKYTNFKELISDVSVSTSAFKSYEKLSKSNKLNIQVITPDNNYLPFNKKNLLKDKMSRVSIKLI